MALITKCETFAADGQSSIKILRGILFTSTTADTLTLKEGSSGGTVKFTFAVGAGSSTGFSFPEGGVTSTTGNWYVDVTTTGTPAITLIGD